VVYGSYRPIKKPVSQHHHYDGAADHLVRTEWYAANRYYAEAGQYIELTDVEVVANGWTGNDLAVAFPKIFPECTCDIEKTEVDPDTTIMVRPFTNRLAAIEELLALSDQPRVWGFYEEHVLRIRKDFGSVSFDETEPGVTVSVQLKVDGAAETCTVLYQPHESQGATPYRLGVDAPHLTTVNKDGASYVGEDPVVASERNAFRDATGTATSLAAAQQEGLAEIAKRGYLQWEGDCGLRGIYGAPAVRAGQLLYCGAAAGALITDTTVNVDAETVQLTLGSHGYKPKNKARPAKTISPPRDPGARGERDYPYKRRRDNRRRT
jgi:hypothetical protein